MTEEHEPFSSGGGIAQFVSRPPVKRPPVKRLPVKLGTEVRIPVGDNGYFKKQLLKKKKKILSKVNNIQAKIKNKKKTENTIKVM